MIRLRLFLLLIAVIAIPRMAVSKFTYSNLLSRDFNTYRLEHSALHKFTLFTENQLDFHHSAFYFPKKEETFDERENTRLKLRSSKYLNGHEIYFHSSVKRQIYGRERKINVLSGVGGELSYLNCSAGLFWHYYRRKNDNFYDRENGIMGKASTNFSPVENLKISLNGKYDLLPQLPEQYSSDSLIYSARIFDFINLKSRNRFLYRSNQFYRNGLIENKTKVERKFNIAIDTREWNNFIFKGRAGVNSANKDRSPTSADSIRQEELDRYSWDRFKYDYSGRVMFNSSHFSSKVSYGYQDKLLDYNADEKDRFKEYGEFGITAKLKFPKDTLFLQGNSKVTSFDDNRKKSISTKRGVHEWYLKGRYFHQFEDFLGFRLTTLFSEDHNIYLYSARSEDNKRQRTYFLNPQIDIDLFENWKVIQKFPIRATYLIYDYNYYEPYRHRLLRKGRYLLKLIMDREYLNCEVSYSPKIEDYGELTRNKNWLERLIWVRYSHSLNVRLGIDGDKLSLTLENLLEIRDEFEWKQSAQRDLLTKDLVKSLNRDKFSLEVEYSYSPFWNISLEGSILKDFYRDSPDDEYISLRLSNSLMF